VTGQKIWTTLAQDATHIFALVRTDKAAKKQAGISFLLVDLATPGITVRPITNIAGEQEFCEVFFDQVRVPRTNLVGELNRGWSIAKALLGFERIFIGSPQQSSTRWAGRGSARARCAVRRLGVRRPLRHLARMSRISAPTRILRPYEAGETLRPCPCSRSGD
jgi:alkylation response protein AidB-like acyl-CoA dehydrogenase